MGKPRNKQKAFSVGRESQQHLWPLPRNPGRPSAVERLPCPVCCQWWGWWTSHRPNSAAGLAWTVEMHSDRSRSYDPETQQKTQEKIATKGCYLESGCRWRFSWLGHLWLWHTLTTPIWWPSDLSLTYQPGLNWDGDLLSLVAVSRRRLMKGYLRQMKWWPHQLPIEKPMNHWKSWKGVRFQLVCTCCLPPFNQPSWQTCRWSLSNCLLCRPSRRPPRWVRDLRCWCGPQSHTKESVCSGTCPSPARRKHMREGSRGSSSMVHRKHQDSAALESLQTFQVLLPCPIVSDGIHENWTSKLHLRGNHWRRLISWDCVVGSLIPPTWTSSGIIIASVGSGIIQPAIETSWYINNIQ